MSLPGFYIVGAARSGTTALWATLRRHPGIFLSDVKEARFFAFDSGRPPRHGEPPPGGPWESDQAAYEALFAAAEPSQVVGDISPRYLITPGTAERIAARVPDARIVAVLRQPVDRAYSYWMLYRRAGIEELSFEAALADGPRRDAEGWFPGLTYLEAGDYRRWLAPYLSTFPRTQVLVCLHDELRARPAETMRRIVSFVGADPDRLRDHEMLERNAAYVPRSDLLERAASLLSPLSQRVLPEPALEAGRSLLRRMNGTRPQLDPRLRARLEPFVADQVDALRELAGVDASGWLEGSQVAAA